MEFLGSLGFDIGRYIIPFLFVLTLIVFVHEMGHFLVARWCGVKVSTFSVGFGPELVGRTDRHGTRWKFSVIPLGGYVKFAGDENAASVPDHEAIANMSEEERRTSFFLKPVWQRAAVVAAGPIANFLLAIVIFALLFSLNGRPVIEARISAVEPGTPAAEAGFQPGDLILSVDGEPIESFSEVQRIVSGSPGEEMTFVVEREGERITIEATPERRELEDPFGNPYTTALLGIRRVETSDVLPRQYLGPVEAIGAGVAETAFIVTRTFDVLGGIVTGQQSADQLGGPIRIAQISGDVATLGLTALIGLAAVLSVSIGLINLFPIPMLDGGHLVFYAIEAVRGRPLGERAQDIGFKIGLAFVLGLFILVTFNDLRLLFS